MCVHMKFIASEAPTAARRGRRPPGHQMDTTPTAAHCCHVCLTASPRPCLVRHRHTYTERHGHKQNYQTFRYPYVTRNSMANDSTQKKTLPYEKNIHQMEYTATVFTHTQVHPFVNKCIATLIMLLRVRQNSVCIYYRCN